MTRSIAVLFCGAWLVCLWCHRTVLGAGGLTLRGYWWAASRYRRRTAPLKEPGNYRGPADAPRRRSIAWFPD